MTATLRYDIGLEMNLALMDFFPDFLTLFKVKTTSRWGGVGNNRWKCSTFAISLPKQFKEITRLIFYLHQIGIEHSSNAVAKQAHLLRSKLRKSIGLPERMSVAKEEDIPFVNQILDGDATSWLVYADYLQEKGDIRGDLIRAINGEKAIKVKYGIPEMIRKK